MPGPAKQFPERVMTQLKAGTLARIDAVKRPQAARADVVREAIEHYLATAAELQSRETQADDGAAE